MRVLYLAAEAAPLVKVGGLGDVAGELPVALAASGLDIRRCLPLYPWMDRSQLHLRRVATFELAGQAGEAFEARMGGTTLMLIDGDPIRASSAIYNGPASEGPRFTFFGLGALQACEALGWRPDVIHANDWHAAASLLWLRQFGGARRFWSGVAGLQTIHNLPYMGDGAQAALSAHGLVGVQAPDLPEWAQTMPLPAGIVSADWISTVSPSYAQEIQTPEYGCGLDAYLAGRADTLTGILNGIDPQVWDPSKDRSLAAPYSRHDLERRRENKHDLQQRLGLERSPNIPLLGMITRLAHQKGVDLALEALRELEQVPWQLVVLGAGEPVLERAVSAFASAHAERVRSELRFNPSLARQIYAGADMLLIPSRYEPCGLAQMIAMRYGCVPIVRATGGLRDTVTDYDPRRPRISARRASTGDGSTPEAGPTSPVGGSSRGTGFMFGPAAPQALGQALRRAFSAFADGRCWRAIQLRGMAQDHSWNASAEAYLDLYRQAIRRANP